MPKQPRSKSNGKDHDNTTSNTLCSIEGCNRSGKRLVVSLRHSYQWKENPSGRVCESCYRKDLRHSKSLQESNNNNNHNPKNNMNNKESEAIHTTLKTYTKLLKEQQQPYSAAPEPIGSTISSTFQPVFAHTNNYDSFNNSLSSSSDIVPITTATTSSSAHLFHHNINNNNHNTTSDSAVRNDSNIDNNNNHHNISTRMIDNDINFESIESRFRMFCEFVLLQEKVL
ncbi:hypothetical protein ABK040_008331 [Willaertia magna]